MLGRGVLALLWPKAWLIVAWGSAPGRERKSSDIRWLKANGTPPRQSEKGFQPKQVGCLLAFLGRWPRLR
jgi:hypothetical protein